ncbi:MAG: type II toxin-antitoxin system VapC family toxin [Spirochaetaceae bacterium]|nr:type II toxin-antitoxin system VapC family toxin [Spirochaetaceae bacterium]
MYVLDTNVVSELMRPEPAQAVEAWVAGQPAGNLFFSAVGEAELRYGVAIMPEGRRRNQVGAEVEAVLSEDFEGRVLPFESRAARFYAVIAAECRAAGRPAAQADCQIAAIARARGMAVATRNVRHFEHMGIDVTDPWEDE